MTAISRHHRLSGTLPAERAGDGRCVTLVTAPEVLARQATDWTVLDGNALEPSICAAAQWLGPMFSHLHPERDNAMVLTVRGEPDGPLEAVVPVVRSARRWGLPVTGLSSWSNDFFFSGSPLVTRQASATVLDAMLAGARQQAGAAAMLFQKLPTRGPFAAELHDAAARNGLRIANLDGFERACLVTGRDYDAWFSDNFKRKKRKEIRRLHNRLSETGALVCQTLPDAADLAGWSDEFLQLEQSGWKGRCGTALACGEDMTAFLHAALPQLNDAGKLIFWRMSLDGKPIAMLFAMLSGPQAWLGKIAYDESFARYSPGVLLVLEATRDLLARSDIKHVDSSAIPDHPMINHIWRDRLAVCDVLVATPGTPAAMFNLIHSAERTRRAVRALAKQAYHKLRKGRAT